jgi:hypothetical protein
LSSMKVRLGSSVWSPVPPLHVSSLRQKTNLYYVQPIYYPLVRQGRRPPKVFKPTYGGTRRPKQDGFIWRLTWQVSCISKLFNGTAVIRCVAFRRALLAKMFDPGKHWYGPAPQAHGCRMPTKSLIWIAQCQTS